MEFEIENFKNFKYHGIFVYAYKDEKNKVTKSCYQPKKDDYKDTKHYFRKVFNFHTGEMVQPNGIQIDTTNISSIDVDKPDECDILDQLKNDCKFYVQTKKGFHFYFNKEDELERIRQCKIADVNMDKLWFVPSYYLIDIDYEKEEDGKYKFIHKGNKKFKITSKYEEHDEPYGGYKIIKKEKLVDMPKYAIDWCKMIIKFNSQDETKQQKTKQNKNVEKVIINPNYKIETFNLQTMKIILKIFYNHKFFNTYTGWRDVGYMSRHLNNTEEAFKLFDRYCRKVEQYKNESEYNNRLCFFGNSTYNENFDPNGVLIKCSKLDPEMYKKHLQILYKSKHQIFHNFMKKLLFKLSMIHFIEELLEILYQALEEHLHQANLSSHHKLLEFFQDLHFLW